MVTQNGLNFKFNREWMGHKVRFGRRKNKNDVYTVLNCKILNKNFKYKKIVCFHFYRNSQVTAHLKLFTIFDIIDIVLKQLLGSYNEN